MASDVYDFVVIGSGHNALTTAAYLAKGGHKILILERNDWYGGGVVTKELFAPGFKFDLHSSLHVNIQANPLILNDELGLLSTYGLKYLYPDAVYSTIFDDHTSLITYKDVDRTCQSIARISPRDAEAYRRFAAMSMKIVPLVTQSLFVPAPPQGQFFALLDQSVEGQEIFRALMMSKLEICREWFESDKLIIHLLKFAAETLTAPDDKGTGFILYTMPGMVHTYPIGVPVGGSGALVDALIRCLKAHGAELQDRTEVAKVVVEQGRAVGVRLTDGRTIRAKNGVVGQIHPWLLGDMVDGLDAGLVSRAKRTQTGAFAIMPQHIALQEPPQYRAGEEAGRVSSPTMRRRRSSDFCGCSTISAMATCGPRARPTRFWLRICSASSTRRRSPPARRRSLFTDLDRLRCVTAGRRLGTHVSGKWRIGFWSATAIMPRTLPTPTSSDGASTRPWRFPGIRRCSSAAT